MADAGVPGVAGGVRVGAGELAVGFCAKDRVVALGPSLPSGLRGGLGRDAAGRVAWIRRGARLAPRLGD